MTLTLTLLRCPPNVAPEVREVNGGEFSIGRGPDNDWVLPDPARHLSKRHCVLAYRQGAWQVAGTSTNGTFINRDASPLEARAPHTLMDGDRLILGVYEIEARLTDEAAPSWGPSPPAQSWGQSPSRAADPFGSPFDDDIFAPAPPSPPRAPSAASEFGLSPFSAALPEAFDPLGTDPLGTDPLGTDPLATDADDAYPGTQQDHTPAISDALSLPHTRSELPDDWDLDDPSPSPPSTSRAEAYQSGAAPPEPSRPEPSRPEPFRPQASRSEPSRPQASRPGASRPAASQQDVGPRPVVALSPTPASPAPPARTPAPDAATRAAATGDDLLQAFLRGAGLEALDLPDPAQTMEQLGAAFRTFVSGIRQALIARSEIKREFRIEETLIRRRGNNPLKFSANDEDALAGLLGAGRRTDMGAEEAIGDALANIRLHELATMKAMQTAVRALVIRLGPEQIRDPRDPGGGMALLGNRKARAWDTYEALHAEILRGLSDDFDSVFGKRFALAYEQAMEQLVARQADRRDDGR